jgi:hypothetical protein
MPPRVFNPVRAWQVARLNVNGDPVPVTQVTESGFYTLQAVDTDQFLSRRQFEDYSIRPKASPGRAAPVPLAGQTWAQEHAGTATKDCG